MILKYFLCRFSHSLHALRMLQIFICSELKTHWQNICSAVWHELFGSFKSISLLDVNSGSNKSFKIGLDRLRSKTEKVTFPENLFHSRAVNRYQSKIAVCSVVNGREKLVGVSWYRMSCIMILITQRSVLSMLTSLWDFIWKPYTFFASQRAKLQSCFVVYSICLTKQHRLLKNVLVQPGKITNLL